MRGVDVADQRNSAHATDHKPQNYYWKRSFENKLRQAGTNSRVAMVKWAKRLLRQVRAHRRRLGIRQAEKTKEIADVATEEEHIKETDLEPWDLIAMEEALRKLISMETCTFDIHLSDALESKCSVGENTHLPGPSRKRKSTPLDPARDNFRPMWHSAYSKNARVCSARDCTREQRGYARAASAPGPKFSCARLAHRLRPAQGGKTTHFLQKEERAAEVTEKGAEV
ncbi:unnamed protein product [Sphacelaria rigidula]